MKLTKAVDGCTLHNRNRIYGTDGGHEAFSMAMEIPTRFETTPEPTNLNPI